MKKQTPFELPIEVEEAASFDDVIRQLLRSKPQHKTAPKNKPSPEKKVKRQL